MCASGCVQEVPWHATLPGVVGWTLRHRKHLIIFYLVVLHLIVYVALTHGAFSARPPCPTLAGGPLEQVVRHGEAAGLQSIAERGNATAGAAEGALATLEPVARAVLRRRWS
jgi:hypothetical protein